MTDSTSITYKPFGITHFALGAIFGVVLIAVNAIEFFFLSQSHALSSTSLNVFWIMLQNVGIALPNSYYLSKIQISSSGMTETTTKP